MNFPKDLLEREKADVLKFGATIVLALFCISGLFWLFWSLLVYRGGIFQKLIPFISVVFTDKTFSDYGYRGSYEQGIFGGWAVNTVSLAILAVIIWWNIVKLRRK